MKIAINSKTSGKYEKRFLNNREHLVTEMVPIVGNSVMNRGFYPLTEVQNSFDQLNFLPAPNGHPIVNGISVSAFHPLAINSFNIGGMVRNPRMDGNKVINEFWLDTEIANQSKDGKELIRRIENGEKVGVSTGLNLKQEFVKNQDYDWVGSQFQFDHVAILLNEKAAGEHVGTELTLNSENIQVVNIKGLSDVSGASRTELEPEFLNTVVTGVKKRLPSSNKELSLNALTSGDLNEQLRVLGRAIWDEDLYWVYPMVLYPTVGSVIFEVESKEGGVCKLFKYSFSIDENDRVSLTGSSTEVIRKVEFVPVSDDANVLNNNPKEDEDMGKEAKVPEGNNVTNTDAQGLTVENAINLLESKGFKVNTKEEAEQLQFYAENRSKFQALLDKEEIELKQLRDNLVANSELTADDVGSMSKDMLVRMTNTLLPKQNYQLASGGNPQLRVVNSSADDYENDYAPNYSEEEGK